MSSTTLEEKPILLLVFTIIWYYSYIMLAYITLAPNGWSLHAEEAAPLLSNIG